MTGNPLYGFTRILTPRTRGGVGVRRRLVRRPYLRLRLSEGDTPPFLSHKLFTVEPPYRDGLKTKERAPRNRVTRSTRIPCTPDYLLNGRYCAR